MVEENNDSFGLWWGGALVVGRVVYVSKLLFCMENVRKRTGMDGGLICWVCPLHQH